MSRLRLASDNVPMELDHATPEIPSFTPPRDERSSLVPMDARNLAQIALGVVAPILDLHPDAKSELDHDETTKSLGEVIALAREWRGPWTQREFADKVRDVLPTSDPAKREEPPPEEFSQSSISKLESRANPNLTRLAALAAALRLTPSSLMIVAEVLTLTKDANNIRGRVTLELKDRQEWGRKVLIAIDTVVKAGAPRFDHADQLALCAWASGERAADLVDRFPGAVGRALQMFRIRAKLRQPDVVEKLKKEKKQSSSTSALSQIETGAAKPSWARAKDLATMYLEELKAPLEELRHSLPALFCEAERFLVRDEVEAGPAPRPAPSAYSRIEQRLRKMSPTDEERFLRTFENLLDNMGAPK